MASNKPGEDGRTSLGNVMLLLDLITEDQLKAVQELVDDDPEMIIGKVLVAQGVITDEELEVAMSAQAGLRSSKRRHRASVEMEIAKVKTSKVAILATKVADQGKALVQKARTGEYPHIAAKLLKVED